MRSRKSVPNSIIVQPRDLALLRGLFESRIMSGTHICSLYFGGKREMAKKRLQKIKAARLIRARKCNRFERRAYFIARPGLDLLEKCGILRDYPYFDLPRLEQRASPSEVTYAHDLAVMDVKVALSGAAEKAGASIREFTTWPLLNQFYAVDVRGRAMPVKPDGFFRITAAESANRLGEQAFFIEMDRSTETQIKLLSRAALYVDHYRSGGFAVRNKGARSDYRKYPFRVLYVLQTLERRDNTAARLLALRPPVLTRIWLTTYDELMRDPFGPIWIRPFDYREAIDGITPPCHSEGREYGYQRNTRWTNLVSQRIRRWRLLDEMGTRAA